MVGGQWRGTPKQKRRTTKNTKGLLFFEFVLFAAPPPPTPPHRGGGRGPRNRALILEGSLDKAAPVNPLRCHASIDQCCCFTLSASLKVLFDHTCYMEHEFVLQTI